MHKAEELKKKLEAEDRQVAEVQAAVSGLINYAGVLTWNGGKEYLPDLRDIVAGMTAMWAPEDIIYDFNEPSRIQEEAANQIKTAVRKKAPCPTVTGEQALDIIRGLSIHAEALEKEGYPLAFWQCCRLARRLREDFTGHTSQPLVLQGDFTPDESTRFVRFGTTDRDHIMHGRVGKTPVLIFNEPVPAEKIPEGWYSFHLSGRNIRDSDILWSFPQHNTYTGSILSKTDFLPCNRQMMRIDGQFTAIRDLITLEGFCQQYGFHPQDLDRLFPEMAMEPAQGGMTLV